MEKISINLLPTENTAALRRQRQFVMIQTVSTIFLLVMIFLASITVALRFLQSQNISSVEVKAKSAEDSVSGFKDKEIALVVLKNRLGIINQIFPKPSKQAIAYQQVSNLVPAAVSVSSLSVDAKGTVLLSLISPSGTELKALVANLSDKKNFDNFSSVEIESLTRGRDGAYRASIKMIAI